MSISYLTLVQCLRRRIHLSHLEAQNVIFFEFLSSYHTPVSAFVPVTIFIRRPLKPPFKLRYRYSFFTVFSCVLDPDSQVFGSSGFGSVIICQDPGSFHHQTKQNYENLDLNCLLPYFFLMTDVNVPKESTVPVPYMSNNIEKNIIFSFIGILKTTDEKQCCRSGMNFLKFYFCLGSRSGSGSNMKYVNQSPPQEHCGANS